MIAAFRDETLEARIDPFLPEHCIVFAEWSAFEFAAERSECVIAAFSDAGPPWSHDVLQRLGRLVHPPLILIMPLTPQALELVL